MTCPNCGHHLPQEPAGDPCGASHIHPHASPGNGFEGVLIYCTLPRGHGGMHEMPYGGGFAALIPQDVHA